MTAQPRKTMDVASLLLRVNDSLGHGKASRDFRQGLIFLIEHVLHACGLYKGFGYLKPKDMEANGLPDERPGIDWRWLTCTIKHDRYSRATQDDWLEKKTQAPGMPEVEQMYPDDTRRFYYVHPEIAADYEKVGSLGTPVGKYGESTDDCPGCINCGPPIMIKAEYCCGSGKLK